MNESCPVCGCVNYALHGFKPGGSWIYKCSQGHKWPSGDSDRPRLYDVNSAANLKRVGGDKS